MKQLSFFINEADNYNPLFINNEVHQEGKFIINFIIIIHSKYFPDSDCLKAHVTSYSWPNLEEFCD